MLSGSSLSGSSHLTHGDCAHPTSDIKLHSCLLPAYILPVIVSWKCSLLSCHCRALLHLVVWLQFRAWWCNRHSVLPSFLSLCCLPPQLQNLSLFHSQIPLSTTVVLRAKILNLDHLPAHFPIFCQSAGTIGKTAPC